MSEQSTVTREAHLEFCKQRAIEICNTGDVAGALSSFISDLEQEDSTKGVVELITMLTMPLVLIGELSTPAKMREHIEGFR